MTTIRAGAATDVGQVRSNNQDAKLVADNLYAVADGMGGHQGGEVASALAVEALKAEVTEPSGEALVRAVQAANRVIYERASTDPELYGMGTTLCAISVVGARGAERIAVVNVGDSRVYLFRDDALTQLTRDHSLVEELRLEGRITEEQAAIHPRRNIVTRALGIEPDVEVDEFFVEVVDGDRYLLCSDGLFNEVSPDRISATLRRLEDPGESARELVRLANEGGGRDNITCVVAEVVADGNDPPPPVGDGGSSATRAATQTAPHPVVTTGTDDGVDRRGGEGGASSRPAEAQGSSPASTASRASVQTVAPAEQAEPPSPAPPERAVAAEEEGRPAEPRHRRLTWRVAVFVLMVLAVLAIAFAAVGYYARHTYYVGVRNGEVTIFQGRPGGVLWFDPTVAKATGAKLSDMPAEYRDDLRGGVDEGSMDSATRYVQRLRNISRQRSSNPSSSTTAGGQTTSGKLPSSTAPRASTTTPPGGGATP